MEFLKLKINRTIYRIPASEASMVESFEEGVIYDPPLGEILVKIGSEGGSLRVYIPRKNIVGFLDTANFALEDIFKKI